MESVIFFQNIFDVFLDPPPVFVIPNYIARSFENIVRKQQPVKHLNGL